MSSLRSNPADVARKNGWVVGTVLNGSATSEEPARSIVITAIGEDTVLARQIEPRPDRETSWTFDYREWTVEHA